jgi:acetyl coenzyme A synthetase (ADP forming)-like protein
LLSDAHIQLHRGPPGIGDGHTERFGELPIAAAVPFADTDGVPAAGPEIRDVILRSGGTLRLRPPLAADADAVLSFFGGLSERSLYRRFHGFPGLRREIVEPVLDPDWDERGSLVGTRGDEIVAVANYVRLRDPARAEVAFAVADQLQGQGVGTRLLEQLAAVAAASGISTFVAEVMPDNEPMLKVFADAGFAASRRLEGGTTEVRLEIAPTERYRTAVDERDHVAVVASLAPFFAPATVAVVGASTRRGSIGGELFRNVLDAGFEGAAYPVNPGARAVAGVRAYASIADVPDPVDLAVFCLPGESVLAEAEAALAKGTRAICVISAGFAETGAEGRRRQDELLARVRAYGARLIGPNCLGVFSARAGLNATFAPHTFPAGNIGFSSQSGALGLAVLERAAARGLGLSAFVSIGNKADVSSNDLLEFWEEDPETALVLLYLESFGNPRKFARLARRVARTKPILAMKGGRTSAGQRAAGSHTAALAGSTAAVDALFRQAGVIEADSLEELADAAVLLSSQPLPQGRRVAVLTNAGGLGILCADACSAAGLDLPPLASETRERLAASLPREASLENPVDMLGSAVGSTYEAVLPHVLADPGIDAVIVLFVPPVVAGAGEVADAVVRGVERAAQADKPVLAAFVSAEGIPGSLLRPGSGVAGFEYPESAARALAHAVDRAEWLRRPVAEAPPLEGIDREAAEAVVASALADADDAWLEPAQVRGLLGAYGVPLVAERVAATPAEAIEAARAVGLPVVVKTAAAGAHKTETGGVALDLATEEDVRAAVERIGPPVVVQPMVAGGAELLAGVVQDPTFGPLVAFGPGGIFAELIGEAQFRIAPLTLADAEDLVSTGKAGTLVGGFRGKPPADAGALVDLVLRLARLAEDVPEVAELDLNPVLGLPDGCVVVDARVRVQRVEQAVRAKTW